MKKCEPVLSPASSVPLCKHILVRPDMSYHSLMVDNSHSESERPARTPGERDLLVWPWERSSLGQRDGND